MRRLRRLVRRSNPFQVLAHLEFYDCTIFDQPGEPRTSKQYTPAEQYGIELFQALFLTFPVTQLKVRVTPPKVLLAINQALRRVGLAFSLRDIGKNIPQDSKLLQTRLLSQQVRMHTFGIRNAGYTSQVISNLRGVFSELDSEYSQRTGIKLSALITMWQGLVEKIEHRVNEHMVAVRVACQESSPSKIVKRYCEVRGYTNEVERRMLGTLPASDGSADAARAMCVNDSDRVLLELYKLDAGDFLSAYSEPVEWTTLRPILERWSHSPQGLLGANCNDFFLNNPVWRKPLIQGGESWFYWPIIQIFQSFGLEMLEHLVAEFPELDAKYRKARARFLQAQVAELIRKAVPQAKTWSEVRWYDAVTRQEYETDLMVVVDEVALLIECKSGRITESARRGSPERLRREVRKLIEDASIQSQRCSDFLQNNSGFVTLRNKGGKEWQFDARTLRQVIRLNVTLDFFGPLACEVRAMQTAGLIDPAVAGAPTIALVDLQNVAVFLNRPAIFLHYLLRRGEIEQRIDSVADEMDLLALYLATGFNIGEFEFLKDHHFQLYGLSKELDTYLMFRTLGRELVKPRPKLTPYWARLLQTLESQRANFWVISSFMLLSVAYDDQQAFEKATKDMCDRIMLVPELPNEKDAVMLVNGPPQRRNAIVSVAVTNISRDERLRKIQAAVNQAVEQAGTEEVLFFCHNVWQPGVPYHTMGLCLPQKTSQRT